MTKTEKPFAAIFAKITGGVFALILPAAFWPGMPDALPLALSLGYLISFLFVGSNLLVLLRIDIENQQQYNQVFFVSLALRFMLVLAAIIFVLGATKINQIYFTVSFIISYIFHSVIEIILINKILETDS